MLLIIVQALSAAALVLGFLIFQVGSKISSIVITFVQKSRTIPNSFMVLQSRMRLKPGLVV